VIDANGKLVQTIANNLINGPWDLTIDDHTNLATSPSRRARERL